MKHLEFEYGTGLMGADLPDSTDVFTPRRNRRRLPPAFPRPSSLRKP